MWSYLAYLLAYLGFCNWIQLYYLLGNLLKPGLKLVSVNGKGLLPLLKKKTGLNLSIWVISEKKKMIGFMVSSPPFKPVMIFSEKLYALLNRDELEWAALHESAHYLMWHNLKFATTQMVVGLSGLYIIYGAHISPTIAIVLGWLESIVYIQFAKHFEREADYFAVTHMANPKSTITANIKMKKNNRSLMGDSPLGRLFIIAVSADDRIKMAQKQLALTNYNLNKPQ